MTTLGSGEGRSGIISPSQVERVSVTVKYAGQDVTFRVSNKVGSLLQGELDIRRPFAQLKLGIAKPIFIVPYLDSISYYELIDDLNINISNELLSLEAIGEDMILRESLIKLIQEKEGISISILLSNATPKSFIAWLNIFREAFFHELSKNKKSLIITFSSMDACNDFVTIAPDLYSWRN